MACPLSHDLPDFEDEIICPNCGAKISIFSVIGENATMLKTVKGYSPHAIFSGSSEACELYIQNAALMSLLD